MKRARLRALAALLVSIMLGVAVAFAMVSSAHKPPPARPPAERPPLLLLTSLPLVFGEQFSLHGGGSPALKALRSRYRVLPISTTDASELAKGRLLLMAQPPTQTAENLVVLDQWVRRGGRVLLLADPMLEWPSSLPLGDPTRPAPMFMDTGLLAHWGLRLDAPDERGPKQERLGDYEVGAASPGSLAGSCAISRDRFVAYCRVGQGSATVVADADFLDVDHVRAGGDHNLDALLSELSSLEH